MKKLKNGIKDIYSLTPMQEGMLFHYIMDKGSRAYFKQTVLSVKGEIDIEILEKSFNIIIGRHDVLRTSFMYEGIEKPLQVVFSEKKAKVYCEDISGYRKEEKYKELNEIKTKDMEKGFDLTKDLLMRITVVKEEGEESTIIWSSHHIILDGWCIGILAKEIFGIYSLLKNGKGEVYEKEIEKALGETYPYASYVKWLEKQDKEEAKAYWEKYLEGYEQRSTLPKIKGREQEGGYILGEHNISIGKDITRKLTEIGHKNHVTMNIIMQAVWGVILQGYNNTEDIVFGSVVSGRPPEVTGIEQMVGLFINTIPVRIKKSRGQNFSEMIRQIQEESLDAKKYEYISLAKIQSATQLKQGLIDHIMVFENYPVQKELEKQEDIGFLVQRYETSEQTNYDFNIVISPGEEMNIKLSYNQCVYAEDMIEKTAGHICGVINRIAEDPAIAVENIEIITEEEKQQILYKFNDTKAEYPRHKTINKLFEEQAEKTPDNIAVVHEDRSLTFRELNEKSNRLARLLRKKGVKPDSIVGIIVERSLEMIIGIMGVLKSGGAYLPIDPGYPSDRIKYMLEDSSAIILLTDQKKNIEFKGEIIDINNEEVYQFNSGNIEEISKPSDLAYIIYTSGSIGKPKGNLITHYNVIKTIKDTNYIEITNKDRILGLSNYAFDGSVFDIFGALLNGAKLILIIKESVLDINLLANMIEKESVTVLFITTALFNTLVDLKIKSLKSIRKVLFGGEAVSAKHVRKAYEYLGNGRIIHVYGPTETTVYATYYNINKVDTKNGNIPIGKPISNTSVYILNKSNGLSAIGVIGELCISGDGLARGYLNQPELTEEKFVPNPYIPGERMYRTGDLARWLPDGNIEFIGRIDHQVKIRGFRIEMGEVESQLLKHADIKEASVMAREDLKGDKYLCAYIVSDEELMISTIREHLSKELPAYMIPSYFVQLDKFPLTPNGKLDRKALPEPDGSISTGVEYEAPTNETEEKLAGIWQEVLGVERVGINDSFFELGGDSIKAIQVSSKLHAYGMRLEIKEIFTNPRIKELVKQLKVSDKKVDQGMVEGEIPLTPVQKWFFKQKLKYENHFNQAVMIYRKEGFEEGAVKEAFHHIVKHHDALRMVYTRKDDIIIQYNRGVKEKLYDIEVIDLTGEKEYEKHAQAEAQRIQESIDLEQGPLVKLGLIKTMDGDHLLIVIHHLVIDGVSWRIILEDLEAGYEQAVKGEEIQFQDKSDSYQEWAYQLKEYAQGEEIQQEIEYWKEVCNKEVRPLKKDGEIREGRNRDSRTVTIDLNKKETEKLLKGTNKAYNTEINDILLTALGYAIKGYSGEDKVLIELEGHGREEILKGTDINRTVGWFTTIYPVLLDMDKTQDLSLQIKNIKEGLRKIPKKGIGYGVIKYLMPEERKQGINLEVKPEIGFNYLGQFDNDVERGVFGASRLGTGNSVSAENQRQHAIEINSMVAGGRLSVSFSFDERQFKKETIKAIAESYKESIKEISEHCATKEKSELTPSDLSSEEISIDQIEEVYKKVSSEGEIKDIYYLTPMQEGMLYHYLMDKKSGAYFIQNMLTLKGEVDRELFEKSFNIVIQRHDILRTVVLHEGLNKPLQVVLKERKAEIGYEELREEEKENRIEEIKKADRERHFNISKDHLMRVTIVKAGEESTILWSFHHIIMDGWCLGIIAKEIFGVYAKLKKGKGRVNEKETDKEIEKLQGEVCPYGSYIKWLEKQDKEAAKAYWEKYLEGYEQQATLPKTKGREQEGGYILGEHNISIGKDITRKLTEIGHKNHVTMNIIMQAVWGVILQGYNNTEDIVFGSVVSGRPPEVTGIEQMVGLFINTIPVRIKKSRGQKFSEMIRQIQEESLDSKKHEYISLAEIQSATQLKQGLIDHIMVFENYPVQKELEKQEDTGFTVQRFEASEQTNYDFNIVIYPGEEISIKLSYNQCVYAKEMIERTAGHICEVINKLAEDPSIVVEDIEIITQEEKQQILYDFNDTKAEYPKDKTIHQLFEEQVEKTPDNIAVVYEDRQLTYRELNEKSNQLARLMRRKGVKPDSIVGIMVERSLEMIIGIMGVLKAGGAYLPIDPNYPADRIRFMLEDSEATLLLSHKMLMGVSEFKGEALYLDDIDTYLEDRSNLEPANESLNLAYLIYTSGSTGNPKGVMIEHKSVVNFIYGMEDRMKFTDVKSIVALTSISFDIFVLETLLPLSCGLKIVIVNENLQKNAEVLKELIYNNEVDILQATPSRMNLLMADLENKKWIGQLKLILVGGEEFPPMLLEELRKETKATIYNMYGPTETTVWSAIRDLTDTVGINIGKPIENTQIYIMESNKLSPVGVPGELCIAGDGLARGYLKRPELITEKFVANPFKPGERMYRTGDLARWLPDGNIEFFGRIDHQVKIRGYRIELGEIENRLLKHEMIKEAAVVAKKDNSGSKYLCAYIVAENELTVPELREYLSMELPAYMIPSYFVQLDKLPLTPNGKVDRKAMPEPDYYISTGTEYAAPEDEIEKELSEIWSNVLEIEGFGVNHDFFEVGGNSITLITLNTVINKKYPNIIQPQDLFDYRTIKKLAKIIRERKNIYEDASNVINIEF